MSLFEYLERAQPIWRLLPRRAHPGCFESNKLWFLLRPPRSFRPSGMKFVQMRFIKLIIIHRKRQCNIKLTYKMSWFSRNIAAKESVCICVKLNNQQQPRSQGVCEKCQNHKSESNRNCGSNNWYRSTLVNQIIQVSGIEREKVPRWDAGGARAGRTAASLLATVSVDWRQN